MQNFIHAFQDILELGIFPIVAIIICILTEKVDKSVYENYNRIILMQRSKADTIGANTWGAGGSHICVTRLRRYKRCKIVY